MAMTYGKPIFESYWTIVELWIFSVLQPYIGKIGGDYNCYQYDAIYREYKWRPAHKVRIALQRVAPWQFYQGGYSNNRIFAFARLGYTSLALKIAIT